jgi:hypothetical protein
VGYLLVIDNDSIYEPETDAERDLDAKNKDEWKKIQKINRKAKCTLKQFQKLLARLINSNFVLTQNHTLKTDGTVDKWYIRLTMEERDLMVAADTMGMMKRLKKMYVPDEHGILHSEGFNRVPVPIEVLI